MWDAALGKYIQCGEIWDISDGRGNSIKVLDLDKPKKKLNGPPNRQNSIKLNKLKSEDWVIHEDMNEKDFYSSLGSLDETLEKAIRLETFADES